MLTVVAIALQLDLGGRPGEVLDLTCEHATEAQSQRYPNYGVRFHPLAFKKALKSQQYDDTVFSRTEGEDLLLDDSSSAARREAPGERLLSPLTHAT